MSSPSLKVRIEERLKSEFSPDFIEVIDESHLHQGHVGARPQGESHFALTLEAPCLVGLTRIQQHQRIYQALGDFFEKDALHALRIRCGRNAQE